MLALKIISFVLGLAFALLGYFILFRKRYSLINGFLEDFKAGRKSEDYARRVGLVEFAAGITLLITSIFLIIFL